MKKPLHPMALIFWCVGGYCILVGTFLNIAAHGFIVPAMPNYLTALLMAVANLWWALVQPLYMACLFIGFGLLIELVDQIRWNALPPEKRIVRRPIRAAIRYLRGRS